jgi:hypothetical protein
MTQPVTFVTEAARKTDMTSNWGNQTNRKEEIVMAKVQTKMGGYTIHAQKTEEFTFWWGDDYLPASYFDGSIEPNADGLNLSPLIEEGRKITTIAPNGHRHPQPQDPR